MRRQRVARMPDGSGRSKHAAAMRSRKSTGAIHRREFGPRDPQRPNQQWRCMPRWMSIE
jgi:hypothetical protein